MALTKKEIIARERLTLARSIISNTMGTDDGGAIEAINERLNKFEKDNPSQHDQVPPEERPEPKFQTQKPPIREEHRTAGSVPHGTPQGQSNQDNPRAHQPETQAQQQFSSQSQRPPQSQKPPQGQSTAQQTAPSPSEPGHPERSVGKPPDQVKAPEPEKTPISTHNPN